MVAMLSMLSVGCSSDNDEISGDNGSLNANDKFYMSIKVDLPTDKSGRSNTDGVGDGTTAEGTENGQDFENKVNNVTVLLVDNFYDERTNPNILLASHVNNLVGSDKMYTVPFNAADITKMMNGQGTKKISVCVVCNASEELLNKLTTGTSLQEIEDAIKAKDSLDLEKIKNKFLMSGISEEAMLLNSDEFSRDKTHPSSLGTVKVERAAARFDYHVTEKEGNSTTVFTLANSTPHDGVNATVTLTHTGLINISKNFYLFKRVTKNGQNNTIESKFGLMTQENDKNYVVDTDAEAKSQVTDDFSAFNNKFFAQYTKDVLSNVAFVKMPTGKDGANDNNNHSVMGKDYARLFYCSENTIPAQADGKNNNQLNGITTGVVFKAQISINSGDQLSKFGCKINEPESEAAPMIYAFGGKLYGTWAKVAAQIGNDNSLKAAYEHVEATKDKAIEGTPEFAKLAASVNFTVFTAEQIDETGKYAYYTYYYYWNRHNNNNDPNVMGPMEFGVVRNNVYKLCVNKIKNFGHPKNDDYDPNPINPENPDEDSNYYFEVNVEVQPWVVRVNDIEF